MCIAKYLAGKYQYMFTFNDKFPGYLLASSPALYQDNELQKVILVISHTSQLVIGIQINQEIMGQTIQAVSGRLGINIDGRDPLWNGGILGRDKIHVIHSTDWAGMSTVNLTDDIAVTSDISVLAALSRGDGPSRFRACAGFYSWGNDEFMDSLGIRPTGIMRKKTDWEMSPSDPESVLGDLNGDDQWLSILEASAIYQSTKWF
jgi:putative AlgH/UPF0301 family transcriptional regulator